MKKGVNDLRGERAIRREASVRTEAGEAQVGGEVAQRDVHPEQGHQGLERRRTRKGPRSHSSLRNHPSLPSEVQRALAVLFLSIVFCGRGLIGVNRVPRGSLPACAQPRSFASNLQGLRPFSLSLSFSVPSSTMLGTHILCPHPSQLFRYALSSPSCIIPSRSLIFLCPGQARQYRRCRPPGPPSDHHEALPLPYVFLSCWLFLSGLFLLLLLLPLFRFCLLFLLIIWSSVEIRSLRLITSAGIASLPSSLRLLHLSGSYALSLRTGEKREGGCDD